MLDVFVPFLFPPFSRSILSLFPVRDIYIRELLLLMIYSFPFSLYAPFHFLRAATPPADLSSTHPCPVSVMYHYRVSPKYVHCHHHIVLTSFFFIAPCLSSFLCLSTFILLFFISSCLVFLSCFFMFLCARIFLACAVILLLYIYTAQ